MSTHFEFACNLILTERELEAMRRDHQNTIIPGDIALVREVMERIIETAYPVSGQEIPQPKQPITTDQAIENVTEPVITCT